MAERTAISWTDSTWNPIRGTAGRWKCERISPGCNHCYSETMNQRFGGPAYAVGKDVARLDEKALNLPLHWKKPRRIFVCSMTDLFGEWVPEGWIDRIFEVIQQAPQHTYQILTKRAERMGAYRCLDPFNIHRRVTWPAHVWAGVSVEDQQRADERIPHLLRVPAAVRFLSCEPLLGPVDLGYRGAGALLVDGGGDQIKPQPIAPAQVDWVIVGGESGPGHRPMDLAWVRAIRDQCAAAGARFFYKQGGGARPGTETFLDGQEHHEFPTVVRV